MRTHVQPSVWRITWGKYILANFDEYLINLLQTADGVIIWLHLLPCFQYWDTAHNHCLRLHRLEVVNYWWWSIMTAKMTKFLHKRLFGSSRCLCRNWRSLNHASSSALAWSTICPPQSTSVGTPGINKSKLALFNHGVYFLPPWFNRWQYREG